MHFPFNRFNDLKALYLVLGIIICVTIFFNLILGFSATGGKLPDTPKHFQRGCSSCCASDSNFTVLASNFFVKSIFILNYVLYYTILLLTLLAACSLLLTYLLHELCTSGKCISTIIHPSNPQSLCSIKETDETGASNGMIDLRQFSTIFNLPSNETELLLIRGVPLKKLCTDFRRELIPNLIVCFVGFILLLWGFVNFLINISVNYAKISTRRKYAEILYINSTTEMMPFTDC